MSQAAICAPKSRAAASSPTEIAPIRENCAGRSLGCRRSMQGVRWFPCSRSASS